jgi:ABC-type polysaccharide/polyol phosphate export permease
MNMLRRLKLIFTVHRELLFHLALKNLKIQYKYAFLGFLWAFFVPLCMALVFWFLFSFMFQRPTAPLSIVTALFVWQFMNMSITGSTTSIIDNSGILKKIYFPREIIPISVVFSNFINFLFSIVVLIVFVLGYNLFTGVTPLLPLEILFLPAIIALTLILTIGLVLVTSCLQVFYRDVRYIVEVVLLLWFYMSGVFYDVDLIGPKAEARGMTWVVKAFMLNPVYDLFTMYRMAILPRSVPGMVVDVNRYYPLWLMVAQTVVISVALLIVAYGMFVKREKELVDFI